MHLDLSENPMAGINARRLHGALEYWFPPRVESGASTTMSVSGDPNPVPPSAKTEILAILPVYRILLIDSERRKIQQSPPGA